MFEKITDFDGQKFHNLLGNFSCECFADGVNTFVVFYKNGEEVLSYGGNEANDILDFVLAKFYENENTTIEDGFNEWLINRYVSIIPEKNGKVEYNTELPFDNVTLIEKYNCLYKDWEKCNSSIKSLCKSIKRKNVYINKLEEENRNLKDQLTKINTKNLHN